MKKKENKSDVLYARRWKTEQPKQMKCFDIDDCMWLVPVQMICDWRRKGEGEEKKKKLPNIDN